MQVGDLIQCMDDPRECGGPVSTGLICKIEHIFLERDREDDEAIEEVRYWAVWNDGQYSWVCGEDEPEVVSEGG